MPTVFITGASRGLGLEFARQYLEDDWQVIASCRNPDEAEDLRSLAVEVVELDVSDPKSCAAAARHLKGRRVDLLLNNAGLLRERAATALDADVDDWIYALCTNAIGPALVTRFLLPNLKLSPNPVGATIGSSAGIFARMKSPHHVVYQSSKAAAHAVTISLGEAAKMHGITYVSLRPGPSKTRMVDFDAEYEVEDSVHKMRHVLTLVDESHAGRFIDRTGDVLSYATG